jgi:hypothetical protein
MRPKCLVPYSLDSSSDEESNNSLADADTHPWHNSFDDNSKDECGAAPTQQSDEQTPAGGNEQVELLLD